jgi:hypothetical protein
MSEELKAMRELAGQFCEPWTLEEVAKAEIVSSGMKEVAEYILALESTLAKREAVPDLWLYHWPKTGQRSISKRRLEPGVGAGDEYACYRADDGVHELAREYDDYGLRWNGIAKREAVAEVAAYRIVNPDSGTTITTDGALYEAAKAAGMRVDWLGVIGGIPGTLAASQQAAVSRVHNHGDGTVVPATVSHATLESVLAPQQAAPNQPQTGCAWTPAKPDACPYCSGEECGLCGVDPATKCEHGHIDRHQRPQQAAKGEGT